MGDELRTLTGRYETDTSMLEKQIRLGASFDLLGRKFLVGGQKATLYFVDGFAKDEVMEKILEYLMKLTPEEMRDRRSAEDFSRHFMSYVEVSLAADSPAVITAVLSGTLALLIEGYDQAVMIDARTYPARGVEEPEDDKVLRGAHDGFVETLIFNTALIRRRIRDPQLTMEYLQVGSTSKTDLVLCYMDERVNHKQLRDLRDKLKGIDIPSLTMGQESLAECLLRRQWYNPFPKVRYTERPDCASANVAEGKILLIVDNSPAVMILPTSIFDFIQDTNDFYFPPLVGTYLRFVRGIVFFLTLFLTPIWYLLMQNPDMIPPWLEFVRIKEPNTVPIIIQLLVIEIMIDGVKLASLNTPGALNNAFGMVGALLLGEFAITAGLFVPEVMLYMAFVAVANFTQPSFELGYAFKLFRMLFLILTALFNLWGFAAGVVLLFVILLTTRTISGRSYFFPVIPFNGRALWGLIVRRPITRHNAGEKRR